ncbi:MAG: Gfo/Idh/MocA family protein [Halodesulfurarchaeum sp.]
MQFGVLSTAGIARNSVIPAIQDSSHDVLAIASRDADRAESVATALDIPRAYGSYDALLRDDDLDAIYNPLPNALHAEWTKRAADAGLHVLCEKPFAVDRAEAEAVFEYCEERGVTVMEAFMYRFHPRTERAIEIARRELSGVNAVTSEFSFSMGDRAEDIRLDPDLAGGSLMDVGCYAVSAARLFLGEPDRVRAASVDRRESGVDTGLAGILEYDDGSLARVASSFDTPVTQYYRVEAENGWLEVDPAFDVPTDEALPIEYASDGEVHRESIEAVDQYRLEVEHFAAAAAGETEARIDMDETLANMAVIDALYRSAERTESVAVES